MSRPRMRGLRESGVAVITALLLTTLAISIVASLFWQQQVQVRSMENQRLHLQTKWILRGALDWASLVLFQDGLDHRDFTALDQVWATPLAETRLDQYIERERVEGENFDATLSGNIIDACSRYNLRNLADKGIVDTQQTEVFGRLLRNLQMDQQLAGRAAAFVAAGQPLETVTPEGGAPNPDGTGGGAGAGAAGGEGAAGGGTGTTAAQRAARSSVAGSPIKFLAVDDLLTVPGFTPAMVERLRPFVIVLPEVTPVNVNTAPAEVLASLMPNMSVSEANSLVVRRQRAAWRDMNYFSSEIGQSRPITPNAAGVRSDWFLVNSRIRLDRAALDAEALIHRFPTLIAGGGTQVVWIRQY
ncbi:type II secretion system minor pseudopilin GspK [Massilia sp. Bi118]|uniref:type II secretion system minor pseudopilin GspK n=1 Tax=Massilia sp. Bi118 TaxID=2822346 RepID=UPI001E468605|nr:type II secretion system minor pseudopilin GspK [Massilia sp. Bi118]